VDHGWIYSEFAWSLKAKSVDISTRIARAHTVTHRSPWAPLVINSMQSHPIVVFCVGENTNQNDTSCPTDAYAVARTPAAGSVLTGMVTDPAVSPGEVAVTTMPSAHRTSDSCPGATTCERLCGWRSKSFFMSFQNNNTPSRWQSHAAK
jgi:hypothetical protein